MPVNFSRVPFSLISLLLLLLASNVVWPIFQHSHNLPPRSSFPSPSTILSLLLAFFIFVLTLFFFLTYYFWLTFSTRYIPDFNRLFLFISPFRTRWSLSTAQRHEVEARVAPVHSPSRGMLAERRRLWKNSCKREGMEMKEGWRKGRLGRLLVNFITVNFAFWTRQERNIKREREREVDWIHMPGILSLTLTESETRVTFWVKKKILFFFFKEFSSFWYSSIFEF